MKIVMMGSGGVGGLIGARLAHAGCDVSFVARGAHLAAMREHGLKLESQVGDVHLTKPRVTDDPATLGKADLVIFSVKLWDTEKAAELTRPMVGPHTRVITLQNGIDSYERVSPATLARRIAKTSPGTGAWRHFFSGFSNGLLGFLPNFCRFAMLNQFQTQ